MDTPFNLIGGPAESFRDETRGHLTSPGGEGRREAPGEGLRSTDRAKSLTRSLRSRPPPRWGEVAAALVEAANA
jgi:hypothetical protein